MALDPNIALNVKGLEVPNPVAQYAQVAQLQSLQNQNQVSQMQLDQMRRDDETLRQIQATAVKNGGPSDLGEIADAYLKSGNPKFVEFGIGLRQKLDDQAAFKRIGQMGAAPTPINAMARPSGALGSGTFGVFPEPTANALAPAPAPTGPDVNTLRAKRDAYIALGTPQSIAAARAMDADIALLSKESPETQTMRSLGYPLTTEGYKQYREAQRTERLLTPEEEAQKVRIGLASRPPATPATPSAPVAVVDPKTGKPILVSREQAMGMTPANAMEGLTPKDIQKREAAYPKATGALKSFETETDAFDKDIEKLRNHPGLSEITGFVGGRTPALTGAGRQAQALYEKITAKGGFQALQNMRNASPTGGALGNVSNQEGLRLEKSVAAIDRRQDAKDVQAALDTYRSDLQNAKRLMREAYDDTYSYKSGAGGAADPLGIR
jgi:hypothetical protein